MAVTAASLAGVRSYVDTSDTANTIQNKKDLGQGDFLELMSAQLKNQDPFAPMENGEFIAQMAQFSTVNGLEEIKTALTGLSEEMNSFRISNASSLVGKQVLVTGNTARANSEGEIHGMVTLSERADRVKITYKDDITGETLHTQTLGMQNVGDVAFEWTDVPDKITDTNRKVRISVEVTNNNESQTLGAKVYARVQGVTLPTDGGDVTLKIEDYDDQQFMEVSALR